MIGGRIFDNKRTGYRVLDAVRVLRGSSAVVLQPRQIVKTTVLVERDFGNLLRGENVSPRTRHIRLSKGRTYSMDLFDWNFGNYKSSGLFVPKLVVEKLRRGLSGIDVITSAFNFRWGFGNSF